jgi:hypothetical protein
MYRIAGVKVEVRVGDEIVTVDSLIMALRTTFDPEAARGGGTLASESTPVLKF